jgi:WD40 repeat protein
MSAVRGSLAADVQGLHDHAAGLLAAVPGLRAERLLVAVDQGEELFTRTDADARQRLADLIRVAARGPVQMVITLRSEFLDDLRDIAGLEDVPMNVFVLPPLSRDMLPRVIEGPARVAGLRLEPELVPRLVADTGGGDALPLLAFTLRHLADGQGRGSTLTLAQYTALGGVQGALTRQADAALTCAVSSTGLTEQEVLDALVRLVTIDDVGRWSRRQVEVEEMPALTRAALQVLVDRRLLVLDSRDGTDAIGVAHEALLTAWTPLGRAIDERMVALQAARVTEHAAADWHRAGRPDHHLWDHERLAGALANLCPMHTDGPAADLSGVPTGFLVQLDERARSFLEASARHVATAHNRALRRRRRFTIVLSTLLALAIAAASLAAWQRTEARDGQRLSASRGLLAQADAARERDPRAALQLAAAAYSLDRSAAAESSLVAALARTPALRRTLTGHEAGIRELIVGGDGSTLAVGQDDGSAILWDLAAPGEPHRYGPPFRGSGEIITLAMSHDAQVMATAGNENSVTLWGITDRAHPTPLAAPLDLGAPMVLDLAFSPDGRTLAVTVAGNAVQLWDVADPILPRRLGQPLHDAAASAADNFAALRHATFSADGRLLVAATDAAIIWDVTDREHPHEIGRTPAEGELAQITAVSLAPDGHMLATGRGDSVQLWDVTDVARPRRITAPAALDNIRFEQIAYSPDGRTLAVAGDRLTLWELRPDGVQQLGTPLIGHTDFISALAFTPDGRTLLTGGADRTVIQWDLNGTDLIPQNAPMLAPAVSTAFSPDQRLLAVAHPDNVVQIYDVSDRTQPRPVGPPLGGGDYEIPHLEFSDDGRLLAVGSADNTVRMWDLRDLTQPRPLGEPIAVAAPLPPGSFDQDSVGAMALSPDGTMLATAQDSGVKLWDLTDEGRHRLIGEPFALAREDNNFSNALSFSPDGRRLAVSDSTTLTVWDLADRYRPRLSSPPLDSSATALFLPDDQTIVTIAHRAIVLWNLDDPGRPRALGQPFGAPVDVATISGNGRTLASFAYGDDSAALWDLTDKSQPRPLGAPLTVEDTIGPVVFSPDGHTVALGSNRSLALRDLARLEDLRRDPIAASCARAGGPLNSAVWAIYAPGLDYRSPCAR